MALIFGMVPSEFFFSVYGILGIVATLLLIIITVLIIYVLNKLMQLGSTVSEGVDEVKGKIKKTTRLFDVILDLFSGNDEDDDDEEVFVMKKKKK